MQEVRKVYTLDYLKEALTLLENEKIVHTAKERAFLHDNIYTKNLTNKEYVVLVNDDDEQKALDIFNSYYTSTEEDNSFLLKLDNEDLIEILAYNSTYSLFEVSESRKILLERGISEKEIEALIEERIKQDNTPQKVKKSVIIAGYILAIGISILGFAIGWYLFITKARHSITGVKYPAHDSKSRKHGLIIVFTGFIALIFYGWTFGVDFMEYLSNL